MLDGSKSHSRGEYCGKKYGDLLHLDIYTIIVYFLSALSTFKVNANQKKYPSGMVIKIRATTFTPFLRPFL